MTPKQKAQDLVDRFLQYTPVEYEYEYAIQCALIAVDEVIELLSFDLGHDSTAQVLCDYWKEVKKEINNL